MTKEDFAQMINGREYGRELTREECEIADAAGLVVVHGASDDLCELRGAIHDEAGCYEGGTLFLTSDGLFKSECGDEDCPYAAKERAKCKTIQAVWCASGSPFAWTYETDIPHATFDILEDGEPYCRGIVFEVEGLKS